MIPPDRTIVRWYTGKLDTAAEVVSATGALVAVTTRNAGFDGHTISNFEMLHSSANMHHLTSTFVTKNIVVRHDKRSNLTVLPEV